MVQHADIDHTGITGTGGSGITTDEDKITVDVAMGSANTFYDGGSLTLAAGTYFLSGAVNFRTTAAADFTAKLWNGTAVEASGSLTLHANTYTGSIHLSGVVVLAGSETWKISVAANGTTGTLKAAAVNNGAGNNATFLYALKIA